MKNRSIYKNLNEFITECKNIHGDIYDYSEFNLVNSTTPGTIICKGCGNVFTMKPWEHLYGGKKKKGQGCPVCANKKRSLTLTKDTGWFLKELKTRRDDKGEYYDYSEFIYENAHTNGIVICPKHGPFQQTPDSHFRGSGCPICSHYYDENEQKKAWERYFLKMIKKRVDECNYYDYSKVKFTNCTQPIEIIWPKPGSFWETPSGHLNGCGCPICKSSKLEEKTRLILEDLNIRYEAQKRFDWLKGMSLDFYLPDYNIAIECNGIQHYEEVQFFKSSSLEETKKRDRKKLNLCNYHNVKLYVIKYSEKNVEDRIMKILNNAKQIKHY